MLKSPWELFKEAAWHGLVAFGTLAVLGAVRVSKAFDWLDPYDTKGKKTHKGKP